MQGQTGDGYTIPGLSDSPSKRYDLAVVGLVSATGRKGGLSLERAWKQILGLSGDEARKCCERAGG